MQIVSFIVKTWFQNVVLRTIVDEVREMLIINKLPFKSLD